MSFSKRTLAWVLTVMICVLAGAGLAGAEDNTIEMLEAYDNFELSMFVTRGNINGFIDNPGRIQEQFAFFQKHLKVNRLYLELFRSEMVELEGYLKVKEELENMGFEVSAAYTPCSSTDPNHEYRHVDALCYTDPNTLQRTKELFEIMAANFDEILLDDYYFTNCTCDTCREAKGDRSWEEFRLELMKIAAEDYMIGPAKAVNPDVRITLKYPTWSESFQRTGYNTEEAPFIFDEIYTGTETRNPEYSFFRNPRYTSYSVMRHMNSVAPFNNRGNWFDTGGSINVVDILEQAYLSLFSDTSELTLYSWGGFYNTIHVPALGFALDRIDKFIGEIGKPIGIPVYVPHNAQGEDHIYDFWGMMGIPCEPTMIWPEDSHTIMLTAASTCDPDLLEKIKAHASAGGDVILTPGCFEALQDNGLSEVTGTRMTTRVQSTNVFNCISEGGYVEGPTDILMQIADIRLNESEIDIWQNVPSVSNALLCYNWYGSGRIMLLNMPMEWADGYNLPVPALNELRKKVGTEMPAWLEGPAKMSLFLRDDGSCIIESFLDYGASTKLHVRGDYEELINVESGSRIRRLRYENGESVFNINLSKSNFGVYRWEE